MALEDELKTAMLDGYRRSGEEVGYWGRRFRQAVLRNGGLATAKRMLQPKKNEQQRAGLEALLAAGRPDLTLEAIVLEPRFRILFSESELHEAAKRLGRFRQEAENRVRSRERLFPDELEPGRKYFEGARKQVRVNAFERDPRARAACLRQHGHRCCVCDLLFEDVYGPLGRDFIHVHHIKPLALASQKYELDPIKDLVPVCPNCHAMLHRGERVLSVAAAATAQRHAG